MHLFQPIENGFAHLHARGVIKETTLHHLDGEIYAKYGSGFTKLRPGGGTGVKNVTHTAFQCADGEVTQNSFSFTWTPTPAKKSRSKVAIAA